MSSGPRIWFPNAERPDDSGEFDDDELIDIIAESVSVGVMDAGMRRDMTWIIHLLTKARAENQQLRDRIRETMTPEPVPADEKEQEKA